MTPQEIAAEARKVTDEKLSVLKEAVNRRRYEGPNETQLSFFDEWDIGG